MIYLTEETEHCTNILISSIFGRLLLQLSLRLTGSWLNSSETVCKPVMVYVCFLREHVSGISKEYYWWAESIIGHQFPSLMECLLRTVTVADYFCLLKVKSEAWMFLNEMTRDKWKCTFLTVRHYFYKTFLHLLFFLKKRLSIKAWLNEDLSCHWKNRHEGRDMLASAQAWVSVNGRKRPRQEIKNIFYKIFFFSVHVTKK